MRARARARAALPPAISEARVGACSWRIRVLCVIRRKFSVFKVEFARVKGLKGP